MPHPSVGERLHWARSIAGISARELDRLAGKAQGHCAIIEARGQSSARGDTLRAYCAALGLPLGWLAFGEGDDPTDEQIHAAVAAARARVEPKDGPVVDRSPEFDQERAS